MKAIREPVLLPAKGSEIEAAVDVSTSGLDSLLRPIFICQETELLQITLSDAKRLQKFLNGAIKFLDEFESRSVQ